MAEAHIDATGGVTAEMLLGALVDAGASLQVVEAAVSTLGMGSVRLVVARVPRGDLTACTVRVRAPEQTPDVPSWDRVREVLTFAALDEAVRTPALDAIGRLMAAEAAAADVDVADLDLPQVGVLDTLAEVVGVCAAVHALGLDSLTCGDVGVGTGTLDTLAGPRPLPSAAVERLLAEFPLRPRPVAAELTTATGAALLATLARPGPEPAPADVRLVGVGAGDREAGDGVLRVLATAPRGAPHEGGR